MRKLFVEGTKERIMKFWRNHFAPTSHETSVSPDKFLPTKYVVRSDTSPCFTSGLLDRGRIAMGVYSCPQNSSFSFQKNLKHCTNFVQCFRFFEREVFVPLL